MLTPPPEPPLAQSKQTLPPPGLSLIIPASNEAGWIGTCLAAVFASDPVEGGVEVIVVANGCRDATAAMARQVPVPEGWQMQVIERAEGSKPAALDAGDAAARAVLRAYLDADCRLDPEVLPQLVAALQQDPPVYIGATPRVTVKASAFSRAYARFWQLLPFNQMVAPGYGLYAVNAAGRARWDAFPRLISDDTFVRLQFAPDERRQVAAGYDWPLPEGFAALVKVRRRQNAGVAELAALYPGILSREAKPRLSRPALLGLVRRAPLGFAAYAVVSLAVRLRRGGRDFTRGR